MTKSLLTGLATIAIALFVTACQPAVTPEPTSQPEAAASMAPATQEPDVNQTSPDLGEVPAGSKVVSTTTTYQSPGGPEEVGFSLVVDEAGTIVKATTTVLGKSPTTQIRQTSFAENFPQAVEGKKLSELGQIDRVGGSSLTTGAFNKALSDLQSQV